MRLIGLAIQLIAIHGLYNIKNNFKDLFIYLKLGGTSINKELDARSTISVLCRCPSMIETATLSNEGDPEDVI